MITCPEQTVMKTASALVITLGLFYICSTAAQAGEDRQIIAEMKSALHKGDLGQFVRTAEEKKWSAPVIGSAWYVENRAPKNTRTEEADKRAFGKLLEKCISDIVPQLAATGEPDRLFQRSETLLTLA